MQFLDVMGLLDRSPQLIIGAVALVAVLAIWRGTR